MERNIHDGAQQQLVALAVKQRLAETLVDRDPTKAKSMLADIQAETHDALENLRDLARGIYPPLLADQGLAAALQAQARKSVVPVDVHADGIGRCSQEVESAVYFSCLEAMQNVAKYANASHVTIDLDETGGSLRFSVVDDGVGFDVDATSYGTGLQGMADRLDAIRGSLEVRSAPGGGTTIEGMVPLGAGTPLWDHRCAWRLASTPSRSRTPTPRPGRRSVPSSGCGTSWRRSSSPTNLASTSSASVNITGRT